MLSLFLLSTVSASNKFGAASFGAASQVERVERESNQSGPVTGVLPLSSQTDHGITDLPSFQKFVRENKLQAQAKEFALTHSAVEGQKNTAIDLAVDAVRRELDEQKKVTQALLDAVKAAFPDGSAALHKAFSDSSHLHVNGLAADMKPKITPEELKRLQTAAAVAQTAADDAERLISGNKGALIQLAEDNSVDLDNLDASAIKTLKDNCASLALDSATNSADAGTKKAFREKQVDLFVDFLKKEAAAKEAAALVPAGAVTSA